MALILPVVGESRSELSSGFLSIWPLGTYTYVCNDKETHICASISHVEGRHLRMMETITKACQSGECGVRRESQHPRPLQWRSSKCGGKASGRAQVQSLIIPWGDGRMRRNKKTRFSSSSPQ